MKYLLRNLFSIIALLVVCSATHAETRTFSYDENGNRTFNGIQDEFDESVDVKKNRYYEYNDANLLSHVYSKTGGAQCGLVDFLYNYRHSLEVKIVYGENCSPSVEYIEYFFFDPSGEVFFKISKDTLGNAIKEEEFFTASGLLLATHNETKNETTYYVNNHLGSVIASVDDDGEVIERVGYTPYGGPLAEISDENTFLGKVLERDLAMVNLGARMHDLFTRQFLTPDTAVPLAINQVRATVRGEVNQSHLTYRDVAFLTNPYTYGRNNPATYRDQSGNVFETGSDLASASLGAWNLGQSLAHRNYFDAVADVSGILLDLGAAAVPGVPGGAGYTLKGAREGAEFANSASNIPQSAAARASEIHKAVPEATQNRTTIAVTETAEGVRVISSSERRLRPAQRRLLRDNEIEGVGAGHAEVTGVNQAHGGGLNPIGTAASRPICTDCQDFLRQEDINPLSPLK